MRRQGGFLLSSIEASVRIHECPTPSKSGPAQLLVRRCSSLQWPVCFLPGDFKFPVYSLVTSSLLSSAALIGTMPICMSCFGFYLARICLYSTVRMRGSDLGHDFLAKSSLYPRTCL